MSVLEALRASTLFSALPEQLLEDLGRLMTPVAYAAGEELFRQGVPGDHLVVLEDGRLQALLDVPGGAPVLLGTLGAGDVMGELSLLGDGRRTATVRAVEGTTGWRLERAAFEVLRHDARPAWGAATHAIGRRAVERLDDLYRRIAAELDSEPEPAPVHGAAVPADMRLPPAGYVLSTLFFQHMLETELEDVVAGARCIDVPRGTVLEAPGELPAALWIVLRGAVETTMRGASEVRVLRLAGPGRAVGHIGLLGSAAHVAGRQSRARERAVLLELPWERVGELMAGQGRGARRFGTALWTDTVRALQHGERPLARLRAHGERDAAVA